MNYLKKRLNRNLILLLSTDIWIILISIYFSILFRFDFIIPPEIAKIFTIQNILVLFIIKITSFRLFGLYRGMWRYTSVWDMMNIIKANTLSTILTIFIVFITIGFHDISRSLLIIDYMMCTGFVSISRLGIRMFFTHIKSFLKTSNQNISIKNILLIGAGDTGGSFLRQTLEKSNRPMKIIGILDDNPQKIGKRLHDIPILGPINSLSDLNLEFDEIYICTPTATREEMRIIIEECKKTKKSFKTLPSISELLEGKFLLSQFREVSILDLLGREEVELDKESINEFIKGKRVLITGAGGSIGSELVRQCMKYEPSVLIMMDISEYNLFEIDREIKSVDSNILFKPVLADIRDYEVVSELFDEFKPQIVFHAAAYKHVPIQEDFPWEAIKTNVFGTSNLSEISVKHGIEKFVLVSTDKAVRPSNVMGATKRLAEMVTLNYNRLNRTEFMAVRFGNVLGSSGSVIPIFQDQIKNGGPVTITDPEMKRYFMSIPEASQLILQAGSLGTGGEVFILDMGNPIKIIDIAHELIRLSGYEPDLDIPIKFIGTRPGEKKIEELSLPTEKLDSTRHEKIFVLNDIEISEKTLTDVISDINDLKSALSGRTANQVRSILSSILPEYKPDIKNKEPVFIGLKAEA